MSIDESFDSFYGKLNEIVIAKLNLREKIEDAKVVRKILKVPIGLLPCKGYCHRREKRL